MYINYELSQSTKPKIGYVGDNEYLLQNLLKFKPQNNPFSTNTWIKQFFFGRGRPSEVYYFIVSTTSEHQFLQLYIQLISEVSLEYLSVDLGTLRTYPIF